MRGKIIIFLVAGTTKSKRPKEAVTVSGAKSAPHYFEKTVPQQYITEEGEWEFGGKKGKRILKVYPPDYLFAEARFDVDDLFAEEIMSFREETVSALREYVKKKGGKDVDEFSEEYSVFVTSDYKGEPDKNTREEKTHIAALLKSERIPLDPHEVLYTLSSSIKYAKDDLVIVDWDGAFIFEPSEDYELAVELFELANWQLLRYRMLDRDLDERLLRVTRMIEETPIQTRFLFRPKEMDMAIREAVVLRTRSISEFQALDREIKLIGDWYSARLFELVARKFKLEEWRVAMKDKLDALEDVYAIASEKFTKSWEQRGRVIELVGWYVLLIGWFILLVLDFYFYKFGN